MESNSISIDEIRELEKTLPGIPEKLVVDFANGINVVDDHIRVQRGRAGFSARIMDGITGDSTRRQNEINASLADGLRSSLNWLTELTGNLAKSNLAIERVNQRIVMIHQGVGRLANFSADTRIALENFKAHVDQRFAQIECGLHQEMMHRKATDQLASVLARWEAGRYLSFSPLQGFFAALDELYWMNFGDYCRKYANDANVLLDTLRHKSITQLSKDVGANTSTRLETARWLTQRRSNAQELLHEGLAYQGDWADTKEHPFCHVASQIKAQPSLTLPCLFSAERASEEMVREIFEDRSCLK